MCRLCETVHNNTAQTRDAIVSVTTALVVRYVCLFICNIFLSAAII